MEKGAGPIRYLPAESIKVAAAIIIKKGPRYQRGMGWTLPPGDCHRKGTGWPAAARLSASIAVLKF